MSLSLSNPHTQEESVARLRDELVKLQQTKVETDEYKKVTSDLEAAEGELNRLITKEQEYVALGKKDDSGEVQRLVYREGVLDDQISNLKARLQAMRDAGEQYRPADTSKAEERLSNAEAKRDSMLAKINDKYIELRERIRGAGREAEKTTGAIRKRGGINFKTILKYTLGIRSLFILFRRMRAVAKEALGVMAQQDPVLNRTISKLLTAFKQLKADVGMIVQPLVQQLAPALTVVFNRIHAIATTVAEFIAALVGQDYIERATVAAYDYADSLKDVGESADKALGSYDKLNVISSNNGNKDNTLALTKDTVKYTKEALDDDSWNVKLGRRLHEVITYVSQGVDSIFEKLEKATWFEGMKQSLKKLLNNPDAFLIAIGIGAVGIKLGKLLLAGVGASGFSEGLAGLLPKAATIAVTAVVGYKLGNKIYESLPEGAKEQLENFFKFMYGDPDDPTDGAVGDIEKHTTGYWEEVMGVMDEMRTNFGTYFRRWFTGNPDSPDAGVGEMHFHIRTDMTFDEMQFKLMQARVREFVNNVKTATTKLTKNVFTKIKEAFNFKSAFEKSWNEQHSFDRFTDPEISIWKNHTAAQFNEAGKKSKNAYIEGLQSVPLEASGAIHSIVTFANEIRSGVAETLTNIGSVMGGALFGGFSTANTSNETSIITSVQTSITTISDRIKSAIAKVRDSIDPDIMAAKGKSVGSGMMNGIITGITNSASNMATTLVEKVLNAITGAYNAAAPVAKSALTPLLTGTVTPVAGTLSTVTDSITQTINLMLDGKVVSKVVYDNMSKTFKQIGNLNGLFS